MNPDLKVYETYVRIDEKVEGLKPGMFARVEILVAELNDVINVPLQAVHQSGTRTFVYVENGTKTELREVEVGENNDSVVHIKSGLNEGELVHLTKPEGAETLPEPERDEFLERTEMPGSRGAGGSGVGAPIDDGNVPMGPTNTKAAGTTGENPERRGQRGTRGAMTPEQRAALQERMKGMSEEERQKFMEGMRKAGESRGTSPEGTTGQGGGGD
jgi:hypothetical protein